MNISVFSLTRYHIQFFENAIIYSCMRSTSLNMFSANCREALPHFDKNGILGGELPPLRKLKNNPWWLLNILVHDVINLLYDKHLTDKQKYFYVWNLLLQKLIHQLWLVIKDNLHLGISILSNT